MKRIVSALLFISLLLPFCIGLFSCAPDSTEDGESNGTPKLIKITDSFKIIYNPGDMSEYSFATDFAKDLEKEHGIKLQTLAYTEEESEFEIQIGTLKTRNEYLSAKETLDAHGTAGIGVCVIRSTENKLSLFASGTKALKVGLEELKKLISEESTYEAGLDKLIIFDIKKYEQTGEVVGYTINDLQNFSKATSVAVNNKALTDFSPEVLEYSYEIAYKESYPVVSVVPLSKSATATLEQASEANGGIATITITSGNEQSITVYKIRVNMNYNHELEAEIVNKGGAKGAVSFVIDDGDKPTATFAKSMIEKYDDLKLGFAIKGNSIASLTTTNENGELEYKMSDGKYTYTVNEPNLNFWLDIKSTGRAEILNHTFTHAFHGTNDDGGEFEYVKNGEDTITLSDEFPKGSSTKEILAMKQVLSDLGLSDAPLTLIHAGIGVRTQDYSALDSSSGIRKKITTYKTYFNQVLTAAIESGELIGARSTFSIANDSQLASKIITPKIAYEKRASGVPAFMIEDFTDPKINADPNYRSNLDSWKTHINNAIAQGGLACFCIHNISDTQQGYHHINKDQAEALFAYADSLAGELAIMNFTEAMKYYHEWNQATVTATAYKEEYIILSVTDTLDDKLYDEALTVKVYLEEGFGNSAKLVDGNAERELAVKSEDGRRFVLVDIVPDTASVKILFQ